MSIFIEILNSWVWNRENILYRMNGNQIAEKKKKKIYEKPYESMIWTYAAIHKAIVAECDKLLIDF